MRHMVVDGLDAYLHADTCQLPDGDVGYFQLTKYDCLSACLATVLQVPLQDVPKPAGLGHDGELLAWAHNEHRRMPEQLDHAPINFRRWIGSSLPLEVVDGIKMNHVVVFRYDQIYFDPASGWEFPGGQRSPTPTEFQRALTLEPMKGHSSC